MEGLAKIANSNNWIPEAEVKRYFNERPTFNMDPEVRRQFDEAFTPQGYNRVERNTKPSNAVGLGIASGLVGGLSGSALGKRTALAGAGVGGLIGGAVGYQRGKKDVVNKPIYSEEQSEAQDELYGHPEAVDYFESIASETSLGLAKVANTIPREDVNAYNNKEGNEE